MVKSPERRTERFTIRLPEKLRRDLDAAAARDRRSVSDWVVLALEAAVQAGPLAPEPAPPGVDLAKILGLKRPRARKL